MRVPPAVRDNLIEHAELAQHACSVWPKHHPGADLANLLSPLIDDYVDADSMQCDGCSDSTNPAADHGYPFLPHVADYRVCTLVRIRNVEQRSVRRQKKLPTRRQNEKIKTKAVGKALSEFDTACALSFNFLPVPVFTEDKLRDST
jgi:hypothetical protein